MSPTRRGFLTSRQPAATSSPVLDDHREEGVAVAIELGFFYTWQVRNIGMRPSARCYLFDKDLVVENHIGRHILRASYFRTFPPKRLE